MDDPQEVMRELQEREAEERFVLAARAIQRFFNQLPADEQAAVLNCAGLQISDIQQEQPRES